MRVCNNLPQPNPYILVFGGCGRLLRTLTPPRSTFLYLQFLARCHPYILLHLTLGAHAQQGLRSDGHIPVCQCVCLSVTKLAQSSLGSTLRRRSYQYICREIVNFQNACAYVKLTSRAYNFSGSPVFNGIF